MSRKRPTSADVARLAGVSRTTVSFVLNETPSVQISTQTRDRVLAAAAELDYAPSAAARSLAGGATRMLGLVMRQRPEQVAVDALLPETLRGITTAARDSGYRVLVESLPPGDDSYAALMRSQHADGLVLSGPLADDQALLRVHRDGFPVVLQGTLEGMDIPCVDVDNRLGARQAVQHLIDAGHRAIACVTNAPIAYTAAADRLAGYRETLRDAGLPFDERLVAEGAFDAASGHAALGRLLRRGVPFTAVFAASDVVALGVIGAARSHQLDVPAQLAVVGFDDIPLAAHFDPPLTTVRLPAYELGLAAGRLLIDRINGDRVPARTLLATNLVVRRSAPGPRAEASGTSPPT